MLEKAKVLFSGSFRKVVLIIFDILCFITVDACYYFLSGKTFYSTPTDKGLIYVGNTALLLLMIMLFRMIFMTYHNIWRYTNTSAYANIIFADFFGAFFATLISRFIIPLIIKGFYIGIWHGITVTALNCLLALLSRFVYRQLYKIYNQSDNRTYSENPKIPVAIIGAGQLGAFLANELKSSPFSHYNPTFFVDKNVSKIGNRVLSIPIYSVDDAARAIDKYNVSTVIIAIQSIDSEQTKKIWDKYTSLGCVVKIFDTPFNVSNDGENSEKKRVIRDFSIEDILFRKPLDIEEVSELKFYSNKTVLVTGGGGSIGSELCRQIAKCSPKKLIIFDIYENNAYEIEQELIRKYGDSLDLVAEIGSVRDKDRLECIFENYRPDVVFHAAAHKHVPLMEHSCAEAIKNNVIGTYNCANMAEKYGVAKFILISTDKAVNPTNVMGASKRICEMIIQCRINSKTNFAAVRFGNVLGSNGSVIPLFKKQIEAGGPVTITDKRIIRYFMTIPEASQLVMTAGAKAQNGELFVLDMGQPVRIYDLAVNMIKLMGYVPEEDIEIKEIGLRPGEKLYEELLMKTENTIKTDNEMIFIEKDTPYTRDEIDEKIKILLDAVDTSKHQVISNAVKNAIKQTVPTFIEPDDVNKTAQDSDEMKKCLIYHNNNN